MKIENSIENKKVLVVLPDFTHASTWLSTRKIDCQGDSGKESPAGNGICLGFREGNYHLAPLALPPFDILGPPKQDVPDALGNAFKKKNMYYPPHPAHQENGGCQDFNGLLLKKTEKNDRTYSNFRTMCVVI